MGDFLLGLVKTAFGYALVGITACLATAGVIYVVGKKLIA